VLDYPAIGIGEVEEMLHTFFTLLQIHSSKDIITYDDFTAMRTRNVALWVMALDVWYLSRNVPKERIVYIFGVKLKMGAIFYF
jgi:hypothetical protein